jgi:hypothetical protein
MRVENVRYPQNRRVLGQQTDFSSPREVAFRIVDENGYHVVNAGKKFPFTISNMTWADGRAVPGGSVKGTALSEEDGSIVRVRLQVPRDPNNFALQDSPVDGVLTLYGVNGSVQYPIFDGRKLRFTVPPASAMPLDLQAIYASYEADKYAADTAAQDEIMAQKYAAMVASEDQAKAAADKAKQAAQDAAAKKQAADDAIAAASGEQTSKNRKIMLAVGGLAALGLVSYFAFGD